MSCFLHTFVLLYYNNTLYINYMSKEISKKPEIREDQVKMYYAQEKDQNTEFGKMTYQEYCKVIEKNFYIIYGE